MSPFLAVRLLRWNGLTPVEENVIVLAFLPSGSLEDECPVAVVVGAGREISYCPVTELRVDVVRSDWPSGALVW